MSEQIFNTPTLIFDEANGYYEPRLARMLNEGWKCMGFDHHPEKVIVTKHDIILLQCADCRNDWDQHNQGQCKHRFPKCIWDNTKHGEEASGILEDICLHGMIGPDGVHYDIHLDGGLFLIPPGWSWSDEANWYLPDSLQELDYANDLGNLEQDLQVLMDREPQGPHGDIFPQIVDAHLLTLELNPPSPGPEGELELAYIVIWNYVRPGEILPLGYRVGHLYIEHSVGDSEDARWNITSFQFDVEYPEDYDYTYEAAEALVQGLLEEQR